MDAGNKILNNRIHDVPDASILDSNGYGGHRIYMDDDTGLVDVQGGCSYANGFPFTAFQQFGSNLYWRTDSGFVTDPKAFHVQPASGPGPNAPCSDDKSTWTFYTFGLGSSSSERTCRA